MNKGESLVCLVHIKLVLCNNNFVLCTSISWKCEIEDPVVQLHVSNSNYLNSESVAIATTEPYHARRVRIEERRNSWCLGRM